MNRFLAFSLCVATVVATSTAWADLPAAVGDPLRVTPVELSAHRPRFSPDGAWVAFYAGEPADIYIVRTDSSELTRLTDDAAEDVDPNWLPDGTGLVFASNREGDYDLWQMSRDGSGQARLFDTPEDEREPDVAAIDYQFFAVIDSACAGGIGELLDTYHKVVFSRYAGGAAEVWFASFDGAHQGRLSSEGLQCSAPSWSLNGLSVSWSCAVDLGSQVYDTQASWEPTFQAALNALGDTRCYSDEQSGYVDDDPAAIYLTELPQWRDDACLSRLPRRYARHEDPPVSTPSEGLWNPSYSANQTLLLAASDAGAFTLQRVAGASWQPLPLPETASRVVWSPAGTALAWEQERPVEGGQDGEELLVRDPRGGGAIYVAPTDFYLQDVRDLIDYPELFSAGASERLHAQRFVARPGETLEFHQFYEQVRYQRRGPFVTADAALQLFTDEFGEFLQSAEEVAQTNLLVLAGVIANHYAERYAASSDPADAYLATYFAVPATLLASASALNIPTDDYGYPLDEAVRNCQELRGESVRDEEEWLEEDCERLLSPAARQEAFAQALAGQLEGYHPDLQAIVRERIGAILGHEGVGEIAVPTYAAPVAIDWTLFAPRGGYTGSRAAYFMAVTWFGVVPLPIDAATVDMVNFLATESTLDRWYDVDRLVGTFMGRPVDASIGHLVQAQSEHPELFDPFDRAGVVAALEALRGPVDVHGIEGAVADQAYGLKLVFLPRRLGLDVEAFSHLTHPDVEQRGLPLGLDVFAVLGNARARQLAEEREASAPYFAAYQAALAAEQARIDGLGPTLFATDLYHVWLATLQALAQPTDLPEDHRLAFARQPGWADRLLSSALAGYAQLKHEAVLYAFQDYAFECDGPSPLAGFVEMPVLPEPRAFVDPTPEFFRRLAHLAQATYEALNAGEPPGSIALSVSGTEGASYCGALPCDDESEWEIELLFNAQTVASRLADIAQREVDGEDVPAADQFWLNHLGALLEAHLLDPRGNSGDGAIQDDGGRLERGVALVADVHTNLFSQLVLEEAIGRIMTMYVVVPDTVGSRLTQGGIFSYYELTHPMDDRLTDDAWNDLLESSEPPALPGWTNSYVEPNL